jgi:3-methyl-2-oxobutanoate hydroxymethyltransferase
MTDRSRPELRRPLSATRAGTEWLSTPDRQRPVVTTTRDLSETAGESEITMLTAYDAPTAEVVEEAGVDAILVGDSMGNAVLGYDSTLPVTVDEMRSRTAAVARATDETLVIADMPFLSFGVDEADSIEHAGRMLKEANADAVKLESGPHTVDLTRRMAELGIPVMAHLGLTPQHVNQLGGYHRQGTDQEAAEELLDLAVAHEEAGAFALVLEHVPANVAGAITEALEIPTIGIGAGPETDGQVLVISDVLGLDDWSPQFSKQFGDLRAEMREAVESFRAAVEDGSFPGDEHSHYEPSATRTQSGDEAN